MKLVKKFVLVIVLGLWSYAAKWEILNLFDAWQAMLCHLLSLQSSIHDWDVYGRCCIIRVVRNWLRRLSLYVCLVMLICSQMGNSKPIRCLRNDATSSPIATELHPWLRFLWQILHHYGGMKQVKKIVLVCVLGYAHMQQNGDFKTCLMLAKRCYIISYCYIVPSMTEMYMVNVASLGLYETG